MSNTTATKIDSRFSPHGRLGQRYLASGVKVALRRWDDVAPNDRSLVGDDGFTRRDYEVVGYVLGGSAVLEIEGQTIHLNPGDSWVVPQGATHRYRIREPFSAIEATSPPAQVHARDESNVPESNVR
jgi:hypothetical protein